MGDRIYGCDDCLVACPPGGKLLMRATAGGGRFGLDMVLRASDQTLLTLFANWFIPHRDPGVIRRNALVASGNAASQAMIPAVSVYTAHPDWILRAHAVWALVRIGGEAAEAVLERRRADETDVRVRAELS